MAYGFQYFMHNSGILIQEITIFLAGSLIIKFNLPGCRSDSLFIDSIDDCTS